MSKNGPAFAAKALPSKGLFIDMLTRDLSLSDCILDLLDNSIHCIITNSQLDVTSDLIHGNKAKRIEALIEVDFTASSFRVRDNCGGISIEDAKERVFLLGNPVVETGQAGLGVYGIGMKRALFKIGKQISISSHTKTEEFKLSIDVDKWKARDDWSFPFASASQKSSRIGGTTIEISAIHPTVSEQFSSTYFRKMLVEKISRAYALFLRGGLQIKVGTESVGSDLPDLAESAQLRAARRVIKKDGVEILVMAGLSPAKDSKPRGWYVFCNGRMILEADKSERTGWGSDMRPVFHIKFNHFLGYVFFRSTDGRKLPWTTTKDGVDRESPIYQTALAEMWVLARPVLSFLSSLYSDVKEESGPEGAAFRDAKPEGAQKIASHKDSTFEAKLKKRPDDDLVSIQYRRSKKQLKTVGEALGNPKMPASHVGERTFDWFYDRNCK